jgi:hypothetical protein
LSGDITSNLLLLLGDRDPTDVERDPEVLHQRAQARLEEFGLWSAADVVPVTSTKAAPLPQHPVDSPVDQKGSDNNLPLRELANLFKELELGDLPAELQALGVHSVGDLVLFKEEDLKAIFGLNPVAARKLELRFRPPAAHPAPDDSGQSTLGNGGYGVPYRRGGPGSASIPPGFALPPFGRGPPPPLAERFNLADVASRGWGHSSPYGPSQNVAEDLAKDFAERASEQASKHASERASEQARERASERAIFGAAPVPQAPLAKGATPGPRVDLATHHRMRADFKSVARLLEKRATNVYDTYPSKWNKEQLEQTTLHMNAFNRVAKTQATDTKEARLMEDWLAENGLGPTRQIHAAGPKEGYEFLWPHFVEQLPSGQARLVDVVR